jgi:hypothetical protein
VTLLAAVGAGLLAAVAKPRWDTGDLIVGSYFAALSLLLWTQSARIRLARSTAPFTRNVQVALGVALCLVCLLAAIDIATRGVL